MGSVTHHAALALAASEHRSDLKQLAVSQPFKQMGELVLLGAFQHG